MKIIGLFFPAFISLLIKIKRNNKQKWDRLVIIEYGRYTLINVWLTTVIVVYGFNKFEVMIDSLERFSFFLKYTSIAILIAVLLPYLEEIIKKYIQITFIVRSNDEKR